MSHRDQLLKAFHTSPEDLAANRAGRLGAAQAQRLVRSGQGNILAALAAGVALAAILFFVAARPLKPVQWILSSALFGAVLTLGIRHAGKTRAAAADGRVDCLTGPVAIRSRGRAGWFLTVAGRSFRMPVRPWQVPDGLSCRVYVAPLVDVVVAIEPDGEG